jgi:hypothetical protein
LPPNVVSLEVHGDFGDEGAAILAETPALEALSELRVSSFRMKEAGAEALAASPHLQGLRRLDFYGMWIGYRGAEALVQSLSRVEHLNFEPGPEMTKEQKASLRRMFPGKLTI